MAANVLSVKALPDYTSILNCANKVEDTVGGTVEACAIVALDASENLVQASSSTDVFIGKIVSY